MKASPGGWRPRAPRSSSTTSTSPWAKKWWPPSSRPAARPLFFAADVTKSAEVKALVDAAVQRYGRLDVMVSNAGWTHRNQPALDVSEDDFDKCYAINVKSIYLATIHATPVFRSLGGGSFINIASTAGVRPRPGLTWYNGSKGAVITTSKSLAAELGPDNIRRQLHQPGVQPRHRPVRRFRRRPAGRGAQGALSRQHPAGALFDRAGRRQCGACTWPAMRRISSAESVSR